MIDKKMCWAALATVALVACGGAPEGNPRDAQGTVASEPAPKEARGTLQSTADACGGLDEADAAALLEVPVEEVQKKILESMDNLCSLRSTKSLQKTISFVVRTEDSAEEAEAELTQLGTSMGTAVPPEPVAGLGDDAVWLGERGPVVLKRLLVRRGNVWIDVVSAPGDLDGARKVAEAILQKMD